MKRKDLEQALKAELRRHPNIQYELTKNNRHPRVLLSGNGRKYFVTYSSTPTDSRAVLNILGDVRRAIRELQAP